MTPDRSITSPVVWVAIDVAKLTHQVLIELPTGKRRVLRVANTKPEIDGFVSYLRSLGLPCEIGFEPTGDYHRPLAYVLGRAGFHLALVSSIAVARTRDALYNSWDKNDPKDAQVILHLLKTGTTQRFLDPLVTGHLDLQELANTYQQVSLRKVRLQHSIITHHLPLYFPEAERYLHSSRAEWFTDLLLFTPCPTAVCRYTKAAFVAAATERIGGRKVDKARWLADFYDTASTSLGLPVEETAEAMHMFRVVLEEYRALCQLRKRLEAGIVTGLANQPDFRRLQLPETFHVRGLQATEPLAPDVDRLLGDAVPFGHLRDGRLIRLAENLHHLVFVESTLAHGLLTGCGEPSSHVSTGPKIARQVRTSDQERASLRSHRQTEAVPSDAARQAREPDEVRAMAQSGRGLRRVRAVFCQTRDRRRTEIE